MNDDFVFKKDGSVFFRADSVAAEQVRPVICAT